MDTIHSLNTRKNKIQRAFVKAVSTCHKIWHSGSHMLLESDFSKEKCLEAAVQLHTEDWGFADFEYANRCLALRTDEILHAN